VLQLLNQGGLASFGGRPTKKTIEKQSWIRTKAEIIVYCRCRSAAVAQHHSKQRRRSEVCASDSIFISQTVYHWHF